MFSKIWTKKSTNDCSKPIDTLRQVLNDADAVVIGAGSGLSTSAGFTYDGERLQEYFSDFAAKSVLTLVTHWKHYNWGSLSVQRISHRSRKLPCGRIRLVPSLRIYYNRNRKKVPE